MGGKKGEAPPDWIIVYNMAKEFAVPPWIIERDCTPKWYKRFSEYQSAKTLELERRRKKHGNARRKN